MPEIKRSVFIAVLTVLALPALLLFSFSATASAETVSPHGAYEENTDYCQTCHDVHDAEGDYVLMRNATVTAVCNTCHGLFGGAQGSSGYAGAVPAWGNAGPDGSDATTSQLSAYKVNMEDMTTSQELDAVPGHSLGVMINGISGVDPADPNGDASAIPGGSGTLKVISSDLYDGVNRSTSAAGYDATGGLYCASCHTPHGEFGQKLPGGGMLSSKPNHAETPVSNEKQLCLSCHDLRSSEGEPIAQHNHPEMVCLYCHGDEAEGGVDDFPHSSSNTRILTRENDGLCLSCHNNPENLSTCTACHGQPPDGTEAPNRTGSHDTHMVAENGPKLSDCTDCHLFSRQTHINGETTFADSQPLETTTVCDSCHSPGGAYNGLRSAGGSGGAKDNWQTRVYDENGSLQPGKEKWCVGCHDDEPSIVNGGTAANKVGDNSTYGFFVNGHGLAGTNRYDKDAVGDAEGHSGAGKTCTECHDPGTKHMDAGTGFAGSRIREDINTAPSVLSISDACNACHDTGEGSPSELQVKTHRTDLPCDTCHEVHGNNQGTLSRNLSMVNSVINSSPVMFLRTSGDNSFADGDGSYNGVCEVCHTGTKYHRNNSSGDHSHNQGTTCTECHTHENGFSHGGSGTGCIECHGHEQGYLYDPDMSSPYDAGDTPSRGTGTFTSHATHTQTDDSHRRGPGIYCADCHDINSFPSFKSGTDANGDGRYDLDEADVCNSCHSSGGNYDGVNDPAIGAKNNWSLSKSADSKVYDGSGTLRAGKEKWCAGCHDESPSVIRGVSAPAVIGDEDGSYTYGSGWGYYKTGHGLPSDQTYPDSGGAYAGAGLQCSSCHDSSQGHIDGNARTFSGGDSGSYRLGYRLQKVDSQDPMKVPWPSTFTNSTENYRLCVSCHDSGPFVDSGNMNTSFVTDGVNRHQYHLNQYAPRWASSWSGSYDSRMTCVSCHNVHGSTQLAMVRDGKLTGREPGMRLWYYNPGLVTFEQASPPPHPTDLPLAASTGTLWIGNSASNLCGHCHANNNIVPESRTPWWKGPAPNLTWTFEADYLDKGVYPDILMHSGFGLVFRVKYYDKDGDAPASIQVWMDENDNGSYEESEKYSLDEEDNGDSDFTDGKIYTRILSLEYGGSGDDAHYNNIKYRFYASDGLNPAIGPPAEDKIIRGDLNGIREVPAEYGSIQEAIDASFDGDTITVAEGVYSENINFRGKEIKVISAGGAALTKIQGSGANSTVVTFDGGETNAATLDGFTIDNQAAANNSTRGIHISNDSEPTIKNSVVQGNNAYSYIDGAGIYINGGGATIQDTTVGGSGFANTGRWGSGIYATSSSKTISIRDSDISYNSGYQGSGVYLNSITTPVSITRTTVSHNASLQTAGGIYVNNSAISLSDSHVDANSIPSNYDGGGIYITGASSSASITGGSVDGNSGRYGGGIYVNGSTQAVPLLVDGATVSGNTSSSIGGGIFMGACANPVLINNSNISGNSSTMSGAGIYSNTSLIMYGGAVSDNTVVNSGQRGGGIYLTGAGAQATFGSITVSGNSADSLGGGISVEVDADLTLTSGDISGNRSRSATGGGISVSGTGSTLNASRSFIRGNRSAQNGGGIYNTATATLTNCVISGNSADGFSYSDGGGIYSSVTLNVVNSTIAGNYSARYGGGMRIQSGTAAVTNGIVWGNSAGTSGAGISGSPTVIYSDIQSGFSGTGNISYNPLFVLLAQASSGNPTAAGDFHIQSGSPVIDMGTVVWAPALDIDGDVRPRGISIDMGADEY